MMNMQEDSARGLEYSTPREDIIFGASKIYHSEDENWCTPLERSARGSEYNSLSENEYCTPREFSAEQGQLPSHTVRQGSLKNSNISNIKSATRATIAEYDEDLMAAISAEQIDELFSAARHGRCESLELLLQDGIPVDIRDENGNTLLIIACQNGNKKVAKLLLRRGANLNIRNHRGNTPLHYCFHFGYGDVLGRYLVDKGADYSAKNNAGKPCWEGL